MKRVLRLMLLPLLLFQLACGSAPTPTAYFIFLDMTGSVSQAERGAWQATAEVILRRLTFGDSIAIYPITDRTLDASPLFIGSVDDEGESLEDLISARAKLEEVREAAADAVRRALAEPTHAPSTDLFAVIDRVAQWADRPPDAERQVFIFSDFLQSSRSSRTADLPTNFERTPLPKAPNALIAELQRRHAWRPDALRNVEISGVLPTADSGRQPVNDTRNLREFWSALFGAMGGRLVRFETYLNQ